MKKVLWFGSFSDPSGYGEAARNYAYNLKGVDLYLKNCKFFNGGAVGMGRDMYEKLSPLIGKESNFYNMVMYNLTPENYRVSRTEKMLTCCMTTFETDGIPDSWVIPIRAMDYVFTYTNFNKLTFENSGINRPIIVVPHGVDTNRFSPTAIPLIKKPVNKFVFGSNFDWTERKNPQALIQGYFMAFPNKKDVTLLLKVYAHYDSSSKFLDNIKAYIAELRKKCGIGEYPEVQILSQMLDADEMAGFYTSLDCYVSTTRGEGWNLPMSEAMACGVPCVATNWSAHTEFMNTSNGYPIEYKIVPVGEAQYSKFPHYKGQNWADIDKHHLVYTLREIFNNRGRNNRKGLQARKDMVDNWTWKMACEKLTKAINIIN